MSRGERAPSRSAGSLLFRSESCARAFLRVGTLRNALGKPPRVAGPGLALSAKQLWLRSQKPRKMRSNIGTDREGGLRDKIARKGTTSFTSSSRALRGGVSQPCGRVTPRRDAESVSGCARDRERLPGMLHRLEVLLYCAGAAATRRASEPTPNTPSYRERLRAKTAAAVRYRAC